jgi:hypothetical protein
MEKEQIAKLVHEALGGNGWAYTNYGGNELESRMDELFAVADIVQSLIYAAVEAERAACQAIAHDWETDYQLKLSNGSASRDIEKRRKVIAEPPHG